MIEMRFFEQHEVPKCVRDKYTAAFFVAYINSKHPMSINFVPMGNSLLGPYYVDMSKEEE